ncbi:hypothetical protein [Thalassobacillus sp. CUG 92003]|uniref:hypothetical protein n=1 Tax=Thalassobacillus sp. CUG 92003 TaxID=2736641 RepID=UPI0015E72255|nr:hypothetical protein [Thalassobacillus sp. CUG 92003]
MKLAPAFFLTIILLLGIIAGCQNDQAYTTAEQNFSTKQEALDFFLQEEHPNDDVEMVSTTAGEELLILRSGKDQYSLYELAEQDQRYAVEKLSATLSLHNTSGGGFEFTSLHGNDYGFYVAKQKEGIGADTQYPYEFEPVFSGHHYVALRKGHESEENDTTVPANVIDTTETMSVDLQEES